MAFPAGLTNGQTTTINGVAYVYSATDNAWTRVSTPFGDLAINGNLSANNATFTGNVSASGNITAGNLYISSLSIANTGDVSANIGAYQEYANVYLSAVTTFTVTNAGAGAYVINSESNPTLYLIRGQKYNFSVSASGHPFWIKTAASTGTGDQYNTGVTNNGDDVGLITFDVPLTAPDVLYYICQYHSSMVGQLRVVNFANIDANIGTLYLGNIGTQSNLGAYQTYANTSITELQANIGAFYNYANIKIGTNSDGNLVVNSTSESYGATTGALVVKGGAGIAGNLWVTGNIYTANLISIATSTLSVSDPLLYLSATSPFPYNYDIGFFSQFVDGAGVNEHTGFSRNYLDNTWTLFSNVFAEPGITINWTDANIVFDPIKVGSANIANTTISTSTSTGALVVGGGIGVAGNVYADTIYTTTGIRWAGNGVAFSSGSGASGTVTYTASASAPTTPNNGDFWYKTTTGILFQYLTDGVSSYWFDVQTQAIAGNVTVSDTYSNVSVEAYIGANIGSYQLYANANAVTQETSINTINANVGAYQTYANTIINNILSPFLFGGM